MVWACTMDAQRKEYMEKIYDAEVNGRRRWGPTKKTWWIKYLIRSM